MSTCSLQTAHSSNCGTQMQRSAHKCPEWAFICQRSFQKHFFYLLYVTDSETNKIHNGPIVPAILAKNNAERCQLKEVHNLSLCISVLMLIPCRNWGQNGQIKVKWSFGVARNLYCLCFDNRNVAGKLSWCDDMFTQIFYIQAAELWQKSPNSCYSI